MKITNLFIFIFLYNSILVNSLDQAQYDCLEELFTNIGKIDDYPTDPDTELYQFCSTNEIPTVIQCNSYGFVTRLEDIDQTSSTFELTNEFKCFSQLEYLAMNNPKIDENIFYLNFPPSLTTMSIYSNDNLGYTFYKLPPLLKSFSLNSNNQPIAQTIPFTWLMGLRNFQMGNLETNPASTLISFNNDLGDIGWGPNYLRLQSINFPSFHSVFSNVSILLFPGYDKSSLINLQYCKYLTKLNVYSSDTAASPPPYALELISFSTITELTFNMLFSISNKMIGLTQIGANLQKISFKNVGGDFSFGGKMPFMLPSNRMIGSFEFTGGSISFDYQQYNNVKEVYLRNNKMLNQLPLVWDVNSGIQKLDLSDNAMTGTIDQTYCGLDLNVTGNELTGTIPNCFSVFFGLNTGLENSFSNNQFLNLNTPGDYTHIVPKVTKEVINGDVKFWVVGENLGGLYIVNYISSIIIPGYICDWKVEKPNQLLSCFGRRDMLFPNESRIINLAYSQTNQHYNFTLAFNPLPPQLISVDWVTNGISKLYFVGSFFSYDKTEIIIKVGQDDYCLASMVTFNEIECTLGQSSLSMNTNIVSYITVANLTTQFTLAQNTYNKILNCSHLNDCNGGGICLSKTGTCQCDASHRGADCSIPYIPCSAICFTGSCNFTVGRCQCPPLPNQYIGNDCSIPLHYISSIVPSFSTGGNASFYGWFGESHWALSVTISEKECNVSFVNESLIICNAPPGTGLHTSSIVQNSILVPSYFSYQYREPMYTCPNNCTSSLNGNCNQITGYCECINIWFGYDCSLYSNDKNDGGSDIPGPNITINSTTGETNINSQQTNYQISITTLIEIDLNKKVIQEYQLLDSWSVIQSSTNNIFKFVQSIQDRQCNVTYTIEEINTSRNQSFAGAEFSLYSGSVKMTVSIENFQYLSNLNTLQLQMKSTVGEINVVEKNKCNNSDTIEIENTNDQYNSLNYMSIKKDAKVLTGHFLDRIESDGRSTFITTTLVLKSNDYIIIGMNLPHCTNCLIDPDFSVLISPEFISECGSSESDSKNKWLIPVAVVIPVFGVSCIAMVSYIIWKKKFVEAPFKAKLKKLNHPNNLN